MDAKGAYTLAYSSKLKLKKRRRSKHRSCNMGSFWSLTQQERRRRRRRRRRGRVMWEFPVDLVTEILIRLPEKSLMRFKCVSKQWSSLISCRFFCDRVFTLTRQKQQQPRLYMCLWDHGGDRALLSMSSTSPDKTCFVVDQDLSIPGLGGFFLNGPRGLMCFPFRRTACIYNPSTKQLLTLPMVVPDIIAEQDQGRHPNRYYIGHDPVNDRYKLLCTIVTSSDYLRNLKSEHWVFVLEAGGSWKKVALPESYHSHVPFALGRSISSGSVVRYMAWRDNYNCEVVCFDVRSEEITTILVPRAFGSYVSIPVTKMKADIIEYGGKIAIFEHSRLKGGGVPELWVFEKEWSRKTLVLQPSQLHLVSDTGFKVKLRYNSNSKWQGFIDTKIFLFSFTHSLL